MSKSLTGTVVSNKMDKTVIVAVERLKSHPLYKKRYKVTARYAAHDEANALQVGDKVEIVESRPISRRKHFVVSKTIQKARGVK
ncbi:30S ribosomal protein S17 [Candidatus Saccharibacteria bacterium]|nr:30S ribosomal protein S17 [Candidatus Saccharibacteria bacterium]